MNLDDLLEPVEADEYEGVVEFGRRGLLRGNLVDEEAVQAEGLLVDQVLEAGLGRGGGATGGPVLTQGGFLEFKKRGFKGHGKKLLLLQG